MPSTRRYAIAFVLLAATTSAAREQQSNVPMVVSLDWLAANLLHPNVRVIMAGDRDAYARGHIPEARSISHEDTLADGHHLKSPADLARSLQAAGADDNARIVLYGENAMEIGWIYMALASVGHGDHVSILDGNLAAWRAGGNPVSTDAADRSTGRLTLKPAADVVVDAAWVKGQLGGPTMLLLDVRSERERAQGYIPGSTLVLWQKLFADPATLKFKSRGEIRALLSEAGWSRDQMAVTYCAIGMRASLMYFAARYAGIPARVYVGSWDDWRNQPGYPIAR